MNIRNSAIAGIIASGCSAIGLFVSFRISVEIIGLKAVGAWVLLQGLFFISRIAEGGGGLNLTRAVAVNRKGDKPVWVGSYLIAGLWLVLGPALLIGLILIYPAEWILAEGFRVSVDTNTLRILIWLCFLNSLLSATAAVGLSVLEGCGKLTYRHAASIASSLAYMTLPLVLIRDYEIIGLALVYTVASAIQVLVAVCCLWESEPLPRVPPSRIVGSLFKESMRTSGMVLVRTGFEPLTKALIGAFGTLAAVAAFDLALRVTTQARVLIQSATQPLLYLGARQQAPIDDNMRGIFSHAFRLVLRANCVGMAGLIIAAPTVVRFAFGERNADAILFIIILTLGNLINSLGVVGYYLEASSGRMASLFRIHLLMLVINACGGLILAIGADAVGSTLSYALCFAYGGVALMTQAQRIHRVEVTKIIRANLPLLVWFLGVLVCQGASMVIFRSDPLLVQVVLLSIAGLVLIPTYFFTDKFDS